MSSCHLKGAPTWYLSTVSCDRHFKNDVPAVSATRQREPGEIIPLSAEHSQTVRDNEEEYAAAHAIDLDLDTRSYAAPGSEGTAWFQVKLNNTYCIEQVVWYKPSGNTFLSWTCSSSDCSDCEGDRSWCNSYSLTVSTEGKKSSLSALSDCIYGDTVRIQDTKGDSFVIAEIGIIHKEGEKR